MTCSPPSGRPRWLVPAQRALHDRTRIAFEAARRSGIPGRFHVSEAHGLLVVLTTAQGLGYLNTVTITEGASLTDLPEILREFRAGGIHDPTVLAPDDDPVWATHLKVFGLRPAVTRPFAFIVLDSLARSAEESAEGGLRIRPVESLEERAQFLDVLLAGYDASPEVARFIRTEHSNVEVRAYLAWSDNDPVAAAAMSWHDEGVVLGGAATLKSHRGLGAQTALLGALQAELTSSRALTLESGSLIAAATAAPDSPSLRNMQRTGFEVHPRRAWRFETHFS